MTVEQNLSPSTGKKTGRRNGLKFIVFIAFMATVVAVSGHYGLHEKVSMKALSSQLDVLRDWAHRPYGPVLFIFMSWAFIMLHFPELVVIVIGGMVYDFWEALVYVWIGCNAGVSTAFLVARFFLRDYFRTLLEKTSLIRYDARLEKSGFTVIIALRMVLFLTPVLTWAIAATGIRTRDYLLGSSIGLTPWLVAILLTLSKLQQAESFSDLLKAETLGVVGIFAAILAAIFIIRRRYFPDKT